MSRRYTPEFRVRLRARIEDGKVRCGSDSHVELLDWEAAIAQLSPRTRMIFRLASKGWSHQTIADTLGLSRSRVTHLLRDAEESINAGT